MWYAPLDKQREEMEEISSTEQQQFNREHFPSTLFGGPEMLFSIEVSVVNSDPDARLLFHDILKIAPECEMEVLDKKLMGMSLTGVFVRFDPSTMQEAESIVQFFRNSTYWQVEYVSMSWSWEWE
jgi:hypothetical protein